MPNQKLHRQKDLDGRRIERRTSRMQSEHSTTELRAQVKWNNDRFEGRCRGKLEVGFGVVV